LAIFMQGMIFEKSCTAAFVPQHFNKTKIEYGH
jgi:hypothetical protein